MPSYVVESPDGRKLKIEGDKPPSESELNDIFAKSAPPPAPRPSNPQDIHLDPHQETELRFGKQDPFGARDTEFTKALFSDLPADVGKFSRATAGDVAAGYRSLATGPEEAAQFSGNIPAMLKGEELPMDKALRDAALEEGHRGEIPIASTVGRVGAGVAETLPMLLGMKALPSPMQTAAMIGFTGSMIHDADRVSTELGEELGKPKSEQNPDKLSQLYSEAAQIAAFTTMGAKDIGKLGRHAPVTAGDHLRLLEQESRLSPIDVQAKGIPPIRQVGVRMSPNVLEDAGVAPLVEQSFQEMQPGRMTVPGEIPAIQQMRNATTGLEIPEIGAVRERTTYEPEAPEQRSALNTPLRTSENIVLGRTETAPTHEIFPIEKPAAPLKDVKQIVREKLQQRDMKGAIEQLLGQPAEVQRKLLDDIVGVGKDKVPLAAGERTIFNEIWDKAVKEKGGQHAEGIRSDTGQPEKPGEGGEGGETDSSGNVQQTPPKSPIGGMGGEGNPPTAKVGTEGSSLKGQETYGEKYVRTQGREKAQARVDQLNQLIKGEVASGKADLRAMENRAQEIDNIERALRGERPIWRTPEEHAQMFPDVNPAVEPKFKQVSDVDLKIHEVPVVDQILIKNANQPHPESSMESTLSKIRNRKAFTDEAVNAIVNELRTDADPMSVLDRWRKLKEDSYARLQEAKKTGDFGKISESGYRKQAANEALEIIKDHGERLGFSKDVVARAKELRDTADAQSVEASKAVPEGAQSSVGESGTSTPPLDVESVTALEPSSGRALTATESLINKLEAMKLPNNFKPSDQIKFASGINIPHPQEIAALGKAVWNTAIDTAIAAVKAGKAVGEAINEAIAYVKKNANGFNEANVRANLDYILGKEASSPPAAGAAGGGVAPPGTGTATTAAPRPGGAAGTRTLADVDKIFESSPPSGPTLKQRVVNAVEAFRTGFSSKFRPLNRLAEDIAKAYGGTSKDVAGVFEQLKGSSGKAEADTYRFDRDVARLVRGEEKNFNRYMFLRRSLDRLNSDLRDIQSAQAGGNVPALNRRAVSDYTIPELERLLNTLRSDVGERKFQSLTRAGDLYQQHMDAALRLQVDSGRMSPEVYEAIKADNQFYAPFKVMKYLEETMRPEGTGKKIDTVADYTKAMEGISDQDFKLGDMLSAGRQNITLSRILAEKNKAMQNITDLAALDVDKLFLRKLKPGEDAPKGMKSVNVMEGGKQERYAVNEDISDALQTMGPNSGAMLARMAGTLFRAGATTLNLPFQLSNLLADVPRQALISKYGIKGVQDLVRYPWDFFTSLFSSIGSEVFGVKNKLVRDFLDSGVAGSTVQEYLTPEALRSKPDGFFEKAGKDVLYSIPRLAQAIEQTSKVLGVKRALRQEKVINTETGKLEGVGNAKALAEFFPEAITEIRRFSGSPDFGRMGKWVEQYKLNLLYMFLNARIQGTVADVGRLTGRDGAGTAAKTWGKLLFAVGGPTIALHLLNHSKGNREDYEKRPKKERENYWLIPKDDEQGNPKYITSGTGEKIRDYWRIPKRESAQWISNFAESALTFAEKKDPKSFWNWGIDTMENISPVNIEGKTAQERLESVGASLNPIFKGPIEAATGRDLYLHRNIVPDTMKKASPEEQYTDRTSEVFKDLANVMPDVAPEVFRSPLMLENMTKNFTAGLLTQFLPRKPVEGRSGMENAPLLQRFQAVPYTDNSEFDEKISRYERESADEQLSRFRKVDALIDNNKGKDIRTIAQQAIAQNGPDAKLVQRLVDRYVADQSGITGNERRILNLPVVQRAQFITAELQTASPEKRGQLLRDYAKKRILTESVAEEMLKMRQK